MRIQNWRATAVSRKQNCILRGLGRSINKQKPGISVRVEMPGFVPLYIRRHCWYTIVLLDYYPSANLFRCSSNSSLCFSRKGINASNSFFLAPATKSLFKTYSNCNAR